MVASPPSGIAEPSGPKDAEAQINATGARAGQHFAAGRFREALTLFKRLRSRLEALNRSALEQAAASCSVAMCLEELGQHLEAIEAYERCASPEMPEAQRLAALGKIRRIEQKALGRARLTCLPADASLVLLGPHGIKALPQPCDHPYDRLVPGHYILTASNPQGFSTRMELDILAGATLRLTLYLAPPEDDAPQGGAEVTGELAPAISPTATPDRTLAWTLTALSGTALASAGVVTLLARSDIADGDQAFEDFQDAQSRPEAAASKERAQTADQAAETKLYVSYGLLAIGLTLGGAAAWMWLDETSSADAGPTVDVVVSPETAELRWTWRWP